MPTIIDSLLVKLGFESSGFERGKNKVKQGLREISDEANKTNKSVKDSEKEFDKLTKSATKFLALIGGTLAVKAFISQTVESNAALDRLAKNLGVGADTISAWGNAAELAGGSASGLQGTLDMLSRAQTELQLTGQSGLIPYFSSLGLSLTDAAGKAKPVDGILADLAGRFERMDRTTANNMGRMMGIDQDTMQLLLKGRREVELMIARQKEHGAVTKRQAEEASRLERAFRAGTQTFAAFGRELLSTVTPAIEALFSGLSSVGDWMRENGEFVNAFLLAFSIALAAVAAAMIPISGTAAIIAGVTAGIALLSGALALLWQDYKTWKAGGETLIDWAKWEPGINLAKRGVTAFADFLGRQFYRMFAAVDMVKRALSGDWAGAKFAAGEMLNGPTTPAATSAPQRTSGGTIGAPSTAGGRAPRGIRNNNPGNLNFAGQAGASLESGPGARFARFGSMQEGVAALVRQIGLYVKRGRNTIRKIVETYAPASENDTGAYVAAVARSMGLSPDAPLDVNSAAQVQGLVRAIVNHENGAGRVSDADIASGYALSRGIRGASGAAVGAGAASGAGARAAATGASPQASVSSAETHIGQVNVYTQATDARGIAADIGEELRTLVNSQSNYGLA